MSLVSSFPFTSRTALGGNRRLITLMVAISKAPTVMNSSSKVFTRAKAVTANNASRQYKNDIKMVSI